MTITHDLNWTSLYSPPPPRTWHIVRPPGPAPGAWHMVHSIHSPRPPLVDMWCHHQLELTVKSQPPPAPKERHLFVVPEARTICKRSVHILLELFLRERSFYLSHQSNQQIVKILTSWCDLKRSAHTSSHTWINCWEVTRAVGLLLGTLVIGQVQIKLICLTQIFITIHRNWSFNFTLTSYKLRQLFNRSQSANLFFFLWFRILITVKF